MSATTKALTVLLLACFGYYPAIRAQSIQGSNSPTDSSYAIALKTYHNFLAPEAGLNRGSEYIDITYKIKKGNPYFGDDSMREGSVCYDHVVYENINLLFNEVFEQIIMDIKDTVFRMTLNNEQVDSFSIGNHRFIHLRDSLNPSAPRNGYYEQLYRGKVLLLKKEKKTLQEGEPSPDGVDKYVVTSVTYYLVQNGVYHIVDSKNELFDLLKANKSELKKFVRSNQLNIRKDKENALIKIASWYDNLTP